jgi:hypothetical protein
MTTLFDFKKPKNCIICGTDCSSISKTYKFTYNKQKMETTHYVCTECYFKHYCIYCKDLVFKSQCPGHSIVTKKGNRFTEDKNFMKEIPVEAGE